MAVLVTCIKSALIQTWIFFLLFLSMLRALKTWDHFSPTLNQKSQVKHLYLKTWSRLSLLRVMARVVLSFSPIFNFWLWILTLVSVKELWLVVFFFFYWKCVVLGNFLFFFFKSLMLYFKMYFISSIVGSTVWYFWLIILPDASANSFFLS